MNIAILGIGLMGFPMGRRLCDAGHTVHVWNRSLHKAQRLQAAGAVVHEQPGDAVRNADLVITMLDNGAVVGHVLFDLGAAAAMRPGSLLVDMSSIKPVEARDHAARLSERHIAYLDAPVSGGTIGAENGTLAIMVGGKLASFEQALPVFNHFGRATHVGPTGAG